MTLPLLAALAMPVGAQTLTFWDIDDGTAGVQGGTGTWTDTGQNFLTVGPPGPPESNDAFVNGEGVSFGGTAGTVTIAAGTSPGVSELRFTVDGYVLTGDEIRSQPPVIPGGGAVIGLEGSATIESDLDGSFSVETPDGPGSGHTLFLTGTNAGLDELSVGADVTVDAVDIGGRTNVAADGTFLYRGTVGSTLPGPSDDVIVSSGTVRAEDAGAVVDGDVVLNGGEAFLQGQVVDDIDVNAGAILTVEAGNALEVGDEVTVDDAGSSLLVRGDLTALGAGPLSIEAGADTTVQVFNGATVEADITTGGALILEGAADGLADVTGDVETTGGSADIQGDIEGDLTLGAGTTVTQTGVLAVSGDLTNGADVVTTADVSADSVTNTGSLDIDAGVLTINGTDPLDNQGVLTVGTQVVGGVLNTGTATIEDGGDVDNDFVNSGAGAIGTILGNVDGDVRNEDGGTLTFGSLTDDGATVGGSFTNLGTAEFLTAAGGLTVVTG
ncbi:beta strand repeat-containing protein, partial [Jannaschia pohangensis]|uniref:beta strand repeat-containing protein n=1 Tax=Jannaschia pohangensis TaxID=390807 RepID=UPI001C3198B7